MTIGLAFIKFELYRQLNCGPLAQLVEQIPFKDWVVGSNPTGLTNY